MQLPLKYSLSFNILFCELEVDNKPLLSKNKAICDSFTESYDYILTFTGVLCIGPGSNIMPDISGSNKCHQYIALKSSKHYQ